MSEHVLNSNKQALLALHSAVLLFALSGLFAKWLALPAILIVFGRAFFAAIALAAFIIIFKKKSLKCDRKTLFTLAVAGAILAFHWGSFFQAIQVSSVAIGLITFATFPVFVSFLGPYFFKEKFCYQALVQALLTVIGIIFIVPENSSQTDVLNGVCWGVVSALSFALLTLLNRKFVVSNSAKKIAFYQNSFAALFLLPFIALAPKAISAEQLYVLAILGVFFTAVAHSIFNYSLKTLSAQTASIAVTLEPIYGIMAAYFLLNEPISLVMIIGGGIVITANVWSLKNI